MVGTLVTLQLKLFGREIRGNVGKIIALVIGGLYLAGLTAAAVIGEIALRGTSVGLRGASLTVGLSLVTLVWPFITLLVAGVDQTLDPGRFALFPVRARQLLPGLLIGSFATLGGAATAIVAAGSLITWSDGAATVVAALIGAVIGACTCVLLARALVAIFSAAIATRKFRDLAAIVLGVVGLGFGLGVQFVTKSLGDDLDSMLARVGSLGTILGWTPLGWSWSIPWEVGRGQWLFALAKVVLALALAAGLWLVWERNLDKALVSPLDAGGDGTKVKAHSFVDRLVPASPAGAVAARSLRYWRRDPRHLLVLVSVIALPFLMAAPMLINGDAIVINGEPSGSSNLAQVSMLAFPVLGFLLMTALTVAGEINYDGSALWTQISAGVTGRDDRWGRLIAIGVLLLPIMLVTLGAFLGFTGLWQFAPGLLGASIMAVGAGAGIGSVAGALWQWPTPPPGQNAFAKSSGGGVVAMLSTIVCMIASGLLASPALVLAVMSGSNPVMGWIALAVGLVCAPLFVWGGVVWGGRILDRSWPEVLKRVTFEKA